MESLYELNLRLPLHPKDRSTKVLISKFSLVQKFHPNFVNVKRIFPPAQSLIPRHEFTALQILTQTPFSTSVFAQADELHLNMLFVFSFIN